MPDGDVKPTAQEDLVAALGALTNPPKAGKVNAGSRRYAFLTLADLLAAARPILAAHRLAVMQPLTNTANGVSVVTQLVHASGHVFESPPFEVASSRDAQALGSASSYAKRYCLAAYIGIAGDDDDDDGEQATRSTPPRPPRTLPEPPADFRNSPARGSASPQSIKYLWTLLRGLGTDEPGIRTWVAQQLNIEDDWSTKDLSQQQVSVLISKLKQPPAQPGDTTDTE